jgi:predicted nucleotidyltransferase component of viral defense system
MSLELIKSRLKAYRLNSHAEEINAVKEIFQEIVLLGLNRVKFFDLAAFHGGTALRIVHGLERFSEDLDFALVNKNVSFSWENYKQEVIETLLRYDLVVEVKNKKDISPTVVKKMILKNTSLTEFFEFSPKGIVNSKIIVKLEVDTHPPTGANFDFNFLKFPTPFLVKCHTLESCFAGKIHALLCRSFVKGRDWYDLLWYISKNTKPNLTLLESSLKQSSPWQLELVSVLKRNRCKI